MLKKVEVQPGLFVNVYGDSAGLAEVVRAPQFIHWIKDLFDHEKMQMDAVLIQSADIFPIGGNRKVIFVKAEAQVLDRATGKPIPAIVFLRGSAICVLLIVECIETGVKYVVLTNQARVPLGQYRFTELPAGMDDKNDGPVGRALDEVFKETGIKLVKADLHMLGEWAPSAGGCDERIVSFAAFKRLPRALITTILSHLHGEEAEHESIAVSMMTLADFVAHCQQDTMLDGKILATLGLLMMREAPMDVTDTIHHAFCKGVT